jgi:uncharacterized OsmC-like protein
VSATSSAARYSVEAENLPGGAATVAARASTIPFDGSAATGELLPGPADLLAAALAACILKNVERFSQLLPFSYQRASVQVAVERQEPPPRIVRASLVVPQKLRPLRRVSRPVHRAGRP